MGQQDSWDYLTNFLKEHLDNFEDELAKEPYAVKVKRYEQRPNLVMFKYSQFGSDFTNPIVRCCRGSVYDIREDGTVKPYLMPFYKFMNYGERGADPINWKGTLYIRDKLDGSLLKLLKEPNGADLWTTNGSFDIDVQVPELFPAQTEEKLEPPYTFAGLRDYALRGHEEEIKGLPEGWVFMFELTSPYNKIIVPYSVTKLYFLGCRDPQGNEHTPEWAAKEFGLTFETPKIFTFKSIDEVLQYCQTIDTNDVEGVVIQDENYNRVKVKTEHYRSLFYLKGEDHFSDERIFFAIRQGSIDDAVAAWPEIKTRTEEITAEWADFRSAVQTMCENAALYYAEIKKEVAAENGGTEDPKEAKKRYAKHVMEKHQVFSTFLFEYVKESAPGKPAGDLEKIFDKIDYKELRHYWMPACGNS
jgi:hypothetical protein